ncbi:unnamed protein product [Rotaria socialis]|uniref:Uncharacterized protein n=1 Tax=Rotaria socialis TaxID=392032 RepID=A0A820R8N2_9BILA|nr:unnamed protein product [Rotaria socialis]CAF4433647.1 unnamed protein product [Rotaria socialis]
MIIVVFFIGDVIVNSIDEQCTFLLIKYKYTSKAIFQYVPTNIINQTALNITSDVHLYQSKPPYNQSFIKLQNLIINSFQHDSIHTDIKQLERAILQLFIETSNILQNSTHDVIYLNDYYNNSNLYRRIKTVRTSDGQFIGNSIFADYLFNKIVPPTRTSCETIINVHENYLEKSVCSSTTASLLTVHREISFDSRIDNIKFIHNNENSTSVELKIKTKHDFDLLLKHICIKHEFNSQYQLSHMMNNVLHDEDLNEILFLNSNQYSHCEWLGNLCFCFCENLIDYFFLSLSLERTMINQSIVDVSRYQATEYIFKNFYSDESIIEHHLDLIERQSNDRIKEILRKYFKNSCQILNMITLRMLLLIAQDDLTIKCVLNQNNTLKYRTIAFRSVMNPEKFENDVRTLLNNEEESSELRIISFQAISSSLNTSEINNLMENVKSNQLRFYLKSLSKQSSLWLGNSGSYEFPFGKMNIIFNERSTMFFPYMIQLELVTNGKLDIYFVRDDEKNKKWEILLIFDGKTMIRFSTMKDFFKWLNNDRLFEMKTLDEFSLKIDLKIDFNLNWFIGYFNQLNNFFKKSSSGIILTVQHGLGEIKTGYKMNFNLETSFKINIHHHEQLTSYIWRSMQKENILFKIEQTIRPLVYPKQIVLKKSSPSSSPIKDFCYFIPHFDSKICLSFIFERLWPSSIAIRLLSDDPSLVYNLTSSNDFIHFNIQQDKQHIIRSYRLRRMYNEHSWMPYYVELSTPTTNYTSFINWKNQSLISLDVLNNNQLIANGSGSYQYDLLRQLSINLTATYPEHIGNIFLTYDGNLTINALKLLGGELLLRIDRLSNWRKARIAIEAERAFFFFKQNFLFNLYYDIDQLSFNLTLIRNENNKLQWAFLKGNSHIQHLFTINTLLLDFNHYTQVEYENSSNLGFQSSSSINGWSLWNTSFLMRDYKQIRIQFNRFSLNSHINNRSIEFEINSFDKKLLRTSFHMNQSNIINAAAEIPGHYYESEGKFIANYTNFFLDFPIIETILEKTKKSSHIHFELLSYDTHFILNLTSHFRNEYSLNSLQNFTFYNQTLYQSNVQLSLAMIKMIYYPLFSLNSLIQYLPNSRIIHLWNGSISLPLLFVSKPLLLQYERDSQLFIQLFDFANLTQTSANYYITTKLGLQLSIINDLSTKVHIHLEQTFIGKRYLLLFEIDRNWFLSLTINKELRYEFISSPIDSLFLLKRIDLNTNATQILPINYYTDNETLIRIEILFTKVFSTFINDFIFDISLKNHSFTVLCHMPLFKREFFSLIWNRYLEKELFHFHGLIQSKFLRRRRFIDYEYNWNLASVRFWTFNSSLTLFSFDPIEFNFNITNDYLWYGKWAIDFYLMLNNRRQLIRFNHKYHYTTLRSNLFFDLHLINSHYDLDFNYYHLNHSIQGEFIRNKEKYLIDGYWNITENILQLNTEHMTSMSTITSTLIKSIIDINHQKIGVLFELSTNDFTKDTQIIECNPYVWIQICPRLFVFHYYALNDGLSTMMLEWSTPSYLSWNYTGHGRRIIPITKFEIDIRTKYILHLHTTTYKFSSIYNNQKRQLTIRREPVAEDADDRHVFKMKYHRNQTFLIHLQVINNHYEIIGTPYNENFHWKLHGYFQRNPFNGSLSIANTDWWLSSNLNFNSSLYISTGRYVQLIPTSDPQIAFELLLKHRFHFAFQYSGLHFIKAFKLFHNSSNTDIYFSSQPINKTIYDIDFKLNNLINQSWLLELNNNRFFLYNDNNEFIFNGSLKDFSFDHSIRNKSSRFFINEDTIGYQTNDFGIIISNLSTESNKYVHLYNRKTEENLTINYYKLGRFYRDNSNIQTPIYDINMIYQSTANENRSIQIFFELLPLQMSSFSFVRGRTFRIGYQTKQKQLILSGNIAFTVEDIHEKKFIIILMNERWKLIYGLEKRDRLYIKWNLKFDVNKKTIQGRMSIQDPNDDMSIPVYSDINGYVKDTMMVTSMHTIYSSAENSPKTISLEISINPDILKKQYISLKLIHEPSKTNLSLAIDYYPRRKLHILLKPSSFSNEKTVVHLYANTSQSQLNLLVVLANLINFNLTLPKSYPETGLLHSSLFIDNEEYFDGRLETATLKLRSKKYSCHIKLNQLLLKKQSSEQILASISTRWIERNSTTALITLFNEKNVKRKSIPDLQSVQQKTWLQRFEKFLFANNLTVQFAKDSKKFFNHLKTDFIGEHGQFGVQLMNYLDLDEDFKVQLKRINRAATILVKALFQIGFENEGFLQEYLNNLTCLTNHRNLLHLDMPQLATSAIDTFAFETVYYVNKTSSVFNHLTHYPRSMNAMISYLSNEIILSTYQFINNFYLETKKFFLSKAIKYSYEMELLIKNFPLLSDSITYFSSNDIRTIMYVFNQKLRRLLSLWIDSPIEYKLMKTMTNQLIESIDKIRFYIDDKLDFLLPRLQIYTPRLRFNHTDNQTFLLTWLKNYNLTSIIDEG